MPASDPGRRTRSDRNGLAAAFTAGGWGADEALGMARVIDLVRQRPEPPGPAGSFPDYRRLWDRLVGAVETRGPDDIEERLLELYAHLHMNEAPYSADERRRMDAVGGYWNHAGGLSPLLKASPWIGPGTLSADFGAGNGLQGLLLQALYPHSRTVQIEISARMRDIGEALRDWLGVSPSRIEWVVDDVSNVPATGYDFIYLYRPVRPDGPGRRFYARFARDVESEARPPIIFSVADCLCDRLSDRYEVFYGDGHLTCFRPNPATSSTRRAGRRCVHPAGP